ncbi:MAG: protein phosphatase 2C domain-containing protein [Candidatus Brocadiia bacterium]
MRVLSWGVSDQGPVRKRNEDALLHDPSNGLFAVADGMGGHRAGDEASLQTISTIAAFLKRNRDAKTPLDNLTMEAISAANSAMYEKQADLPGQLKMGSTIVLLWLLGDRAIVASAGDSRCYRFRKSRLSCLTIDHNLLGGVSVGPGKGNERNGLLKSTLTKVVGINPVLVCDIGIEKVEKGDLFLLCSDGLTNVLSDKEIGEIIRGNLRDARAAGEALMRRALDLTPRDNVSIVIVAVEETLPLAYPVRLSRGPIRPSVVPWVFALIVAVFLLAGGYYLSNRFGNTDPFNSLSVALARGDYNAAMRDLLAARKEGQGDEKRTAALGIAESEILWNRSPVSPDSQAITISFASVLALAESKHLDLSAPEYWLVHPPEELMLLLREIAAERWKGTELSGGLGLEGISEAEKTRLNLILDEARELYCEHFRISAALRLLEQVRAEAIKARKKE